MGDEMAETGNQLLEELMRFRPEGLSPNAWAVKAGVSRTIWQDLKRHGNPSRRTLEKLLAAAGSSLAEFEALRVGGTAPTVVDQVTERVGDAVRGFRGAELPPITVIYCEPAGEWAPGITVIEFDRTRILERLPRPVSLSDDPGAYALTIPDNAMWPRFRPGRRIVISPAAPTEPGDDVLAVVAGASRPRALLKELIGRAANSLQLRQFTPDLTFEIPLEQVIDVHKVLGELI